MDTTRMNAAELDLSDLDVESLNSPDTAEGATLESLMQWTVGHGMTEIGASCCTSGTNTNCSCDQDESPMGG